LESVTVPREPAFRHFHWLGKINRAEVDLIPETTIAIRLAERSRARRKIEKRAAVGTQRA